MAVKSPPPLSASHWSIRQHLYLLFNLSLNMLLWQAQMTYVTNIIAAQRSFVRGISNGCVRWSGSKRDRCRWDNQEVMNNGKKRLIKCTSYNAKRDTRCLCICVVWLATQNHSTLVTETTVVPFLPVNPEYSSTRNQASTAPKVILAGNKNIALWQVNFL